MPRYFFHVAGVAPFTDTEGLDLPDDNAAWSSAIQSFSELLRDIDGEMPPSAEIVTMVAGYDNRTMITLRFAADRDPVE